jgi:hypothetical protein
MNKKLLSESDIFVRKAELQRANIETIWRNLA